jgi:hypothetical protein
MIMFCCFFAVMHAEVQPPPPPAPDMGAAPVDHAAQGQAPQDQMSQAQGAQPAPAAPPAPGGDAALSPENLQPPAEAVMMTEDASSLPPSSPVIVDLFKKASVIIEQIAPVALRIDQKRDSIYGNFFEIDKMLDKTYPEMLEKVGKIEELFMPKNIATK